MKTRIISRGQLRGVVFGSGRREGFVKEPGKGTMESFRRFPGSMMHTVQVWMPREKPLGCLRSTVWLLFCIDVASLPSKEHEAHQGVISK